MGTQLKTSEQIVAGIEARIAKLEKEVDKLQSFDAQFEFGNRLSELRTLLRWVKNHKDEKEEAV